MTKVTRNFQITLPRDVRELEGIDIGDTLIVTTKGEDIILRKSREKLLEKSFGAWKTKGSGIDFVREIREDSENRVKKMGL